MRTSLWHQAIGLPLAAVLLCLLACDSGPAGSSLPATDGSAGPRDSFEYSDLHGAEFKISYVDTGGAGDEAVVLIHGFGASAFTWNEIIPGLADGYRVIALDLKGFGASGKPDDGRYSVFDQAEIVDGLIRHLGLRDVILAGHSMGGTIAMVLASDTGAGRPYRLTRLMIFDAPLFRQRLPIFIMALDVPLLGEAGLHLIPPTTTVSWVLKEAYYDDDAVKAADVEAYASGLASPGGRKALVRTAGALADLNTSGHAFEFDEVKTPVLIVWGKSDTIVPRGNAYALRDALPGPVSFHMLPHCGHFPMTEKPQETLEAIREFLETE
jgi:pimeloyl-ACP methyl ester carboxylesterase